MNELTSEAAKADRRHLLAFAAAQALNQSGVDPLLTIIHVFFPIAEDLDGKGFNPKELSDELDKRYGLSVSEDLARHWVPELVKQGVLTRIDTNRSADTYLWLGIESKSTKEIEKFDELFKEIIDRFIIFARETNDIFFHKFDESDAISTLYELLVHDAVSGDGEISVERRYLFSKFISCIDDDAPELLEFIATLRASAVLADLLLHINVPRVEDHELRGLTVYLDGPLAMDLLGLTGGRAQSYLKKLIELIAGSGARACLPSHYVDEIRHALSKVLSASTRERHGPTAKALRDGEIDEQRVGFIRENLEPLLEKAGVFVDASFAQHVESSPVSEEQEQLLYSKLHTDYENEIALERDISTYKGMVKRRGVSRSHSIKKVGSIFVTRNILLSNAVNYHMRSNHNYHDRDIPVFLSISKFSALLSAMYGVDRTRDLPVQELLSATSRSLEFKPEIIQRIQQYLDDQDDADKAALLELLHQPDYSSIALDAALGTERNLNVERTAQVVEELKSRLKAEAEADLRATRKSNAKQLAALKVETDAKLAQVKANAAVRQRRRIGKLMVAYRRYYRHKVMAENATKVLRFGSVVAFGVLALSVSGVFNVNVAAATIITASLAIVSGIPSPVQRWVLRSAFISMEKPQRIRFRETATDLAFHLPPARPLSVSDVRLSVAEARQIRRLDFTGEERVLI